MRPTFTIDEAKVSYFAATDGFSGRLPVGGEYEGVKSEIFRLDVDCVKNRMKLKWYSIHSEDIIKTTQRFVEAAKSKIKEWYGDGWEDINIRDDKDWFLELKAVCDYAWKREKEARRKRRIERYKKN